MSQLQLPRHSCALFSHLVSSVVSQVISGGNYDVDCFVTDPQGAVLYNEKRKQYDSFSHTTATKGVYKVCFSNEFSTFTDKTVYLDFRHGEEKPLIGGMMHATALTQVGLNRDGG